MNPKEEQFGPNQKSGLKTLKRAIRVHGKRSIDRRTRAGKHHAHLRDTLLDALGGVKHVSPQKRVLLDELILTKLMLDSVNVWIVAQDSLINKRNKSIINVVKDRNALVTTLRTLLADLGLERVVKTLPTLAEYLNGKAPAKATDTTTTATPAEADEAPQPTPKENTL